MMYEELTGDGGQRNLDFMEIAQSGDELLRLVRGWREGLGTKCGVLDNYLAGVLNAMTDTASSYTAAEEGYFEALSNLRGILRQIKEGKEEEAQRHPFYPTVRAYMDTHPFPQDILYYETYCVALFGEYLPFSVKGYIDDCNTTFKESLEKYKVQQLQEVLLSSAVNITADDLKYLNNLISRVLAWTAPSTVFMQGMADQLLMSLLSRDKESGRFVFQRLLDGEVTYE